MVRKTNTNARAQGNGGEDQAIRVILPNKRKGEMYGLVEKTLRSISSDCYV